MYIEIDGERYILVLQPAGSRLEDQKVWKIKSPRDMTDAQLEFHIMGVKNELGAVTSRIDAIRADQSTSVAERAPALTSLSAFERSLYSDRDRLNAEKERRHGRK